MPGLHDIVQIIINNDNRDIFNLEDYIRLRQVNHAMLSAVQSNEKRLLLDNLAKDFGVSLDPLSEYSYADIIGLYNDTFLKMSGNVLMRAQDRLNNERFNFIIDDNAAFLKKLKEILFTTSLSDKELSIKSYIDDPQACPYCYISIATDQLTYAILTEKLLHIFSNPNSFSLNVGGKVCAKISADEIARTSLSKDMRVTPEFLRQYTNLINVLIMNIFCLWTVRIEQYNRSYICDTVSQKIKSGYDMIARLGASSRRLSPIMPFFTDKVHRALATPGDLEYDPSKKVSRYLISIFRCIGMFLINPDVPSCMHEIFVTDFIKDFFATLKTWIPLELYQNDVLALYPQCLERCKIEMLQIASERGIPTLTFEDIAEGSAYIEPLLKLSSVHNLKLFTEGNYNFIYPKGERIKALLELIDISNHSCSMPSPVRGSSH